MSSKSTHWAFPQERACALFEDRKKFGFSFECTTTVKSLLNNITKNDVYKLSDNNGCNIFVKTSILFPICMFMNLLVENLAEECASCV